MSRPEPAARNEAVEKLAALAPEPRIEESALSDARGRILATTLFADRDHPPFDRATMDGYAVRAADIHSGRTYPVAGDIAAGDDHDERIPSNACVTIATGAPVPAELDAVIEHERSNRQDPVRFDLDGVEPGRNIHTRGIDRTAGAPLLDEGTRIGPAEIGIAASNGYARMPVRKPPTVALLSTGDELVPIEETPGPCQIRDSNRVMLTAAIATLGGELVLSRHVPDELDDTTRALKDAQEVADLVLTIGGVSAGTRDHVPASWSTLGAQPIIEGVRMQPGRPFHAWNTGAGTAIALPGNPVSALVCLHLMVRPWLRVAHGLGPLDDWQVVELVAPARPNPRRTAYRPCHLAPPDHQPRRRVRVAPWHGSGDLPHLAGTDGLVELATDRAPEIPAGAECPFLEFLP
ncbi:MAG: molybdopterin molybdotransferase MoeA [Phycisphaerales bacterium]|nr:molybdopterin molybdotransferase MoeA [Phycisphaerales bacterium]